MTGMSSVQTRSRAFRASSSSGGYPGRSWTFQGRLPAANSSTAASTSSARTCRWIPHTPLNAGTGSPILARTTPASWTKVPPGRVAVIAAQTAKNAWAADSTSSSPLRWCGTAAIAVSSLMKALDIDVDVQTPDFDISEPAVDRRGGVRVRVQMAERCAALPGLLAEPRREGGADAARARMRERADNGDVAG